jgi:photosystem II stability/assembly factor-like uncharacterized protein
MTEEGDMRRENINPITFSGVLFAVFLLFLGINIGLLPGGFSGRAVAASSPGWQDQTPSAGDTLNAIDAFDAETAWAVGYNGTILMTSNGGQDWSEQASSEGRILRDVCAVSPEVAWAVGASENYGPHAVVMSTSNAGADWVLHDAVETQFRALPDIGQYIATVDAAGVAALDASTAWVTVNYDAHIPNPFYPPNYFSSLVVCAIWKTVDGGSNWTLQYYSGWWGMLGRIHALDEQTVWTAGGNQSPQLFATMSSSLRTTDGGSTWQFQDPGASQMFRSFSAFDSNHAWALSGASIYKSADGGASWTSLDPGFTYALDGLSVEDGNVAWGLINVPVVDGKQAIITKTVDGGQTWATQYSGATNYLLGVCALDCTTAWAVGEAGLILKTTDGGDSRPDVLSVSPSTANWGDQVTIKGMDFGDSRVAGSYVVGVDKDSDYVSWSDTQIVVKVPVGLSGKVPVVVVTPAGSSNPGSLTVTPEATVTSITPNSGAIDTVLDISDLAGSGFKDGATVRLEMGSTVINASEVVVTDTKITCKFDLTGATLGTYDVVVKNPSGFEARLPGAFSVTTPGPCGLGGGLGLLMLGITLGLLSLTGTARLRRRGR